MLSAIQIGDIFLVCVKLHDIDLTLKGMQLEKFYEAIVRIAYLTYRHLVKRFVIQSNSKVQIYLICTSIIYRVMTLISRRK